MRNLIRSAFSYVVALIVLYYCFLTATNGILWFTVASLLFGFVIVFCLSDMFDRVWTEFENRTPVPETEPDGDGE